MKIAYNPQTAAALTVAPSNNDITFDLSGQAIYARGVQFKGTDTTYQVFSNGQNGLVPAPQYENATKFLREDGQWVNIDNIISYYPSKISLVDTEWTPSGLILDNRFTNGVYAIQIMSGSLIFSGTASVFVGKITVEDEIMLHMSGIPKTYTDGIQGRIYAKIAPSNTYDYGEVYLSTNVSESNITNLSITMKKLI